MADPKIRNSQAIPDALKKIVGNMQTAKLRVGIFKNATTTDGKLIAEYATYNEFGTEHIPPRPFLRSTIKAHSSDWRNTFAAMLKGTAQDAPAVERALTLVGVQAVGHIQDTIDSNMPPPNAESTRRQKRKTLLDAKSRPMKDEAGKVMTHIPGTLVNTGMMRKAISFEVNPE